ncbi:MAG: type II toxin-antitoxin system RelE/ParE family toxin [Acetobacteraceae bacterium]
MSYAVRFAPEAEGQLTAIEQYIADAGSPATAARYVDAIVTCRENLATFPERGRKRDDIMPGLRVISYRRRVAIAFLVATDAKLISVVGVFYGGQDYETRLLRDLDPG